MAERFITKYSIYILLSILILYIWVGYEHTLQTLFDKYVVTTYTSLFVSNVFSILLSFGMLCIVGIDIYHRTIRCYQYSKPLMFFLSWLFIIFSFYHLTDDYSYVYIIPHVSYVGTFLAATFSYIASYIINTIRTYQRDCKHCTQETSNLLLDWPIQTEADDIFDLNDEAKKIAKEITKLSYERAWSLAITAPWGVGKTSFLNLISKSFPESQAELIFFNPRDSKSSGQIQEDFFTTIASTLSKYDSSCNDITKKYMASLLLIDNRGILEKALNLYHIWNRTDLKSQIQNVINHLNKKIIVIIDDFDRLSKEEIEEVLKLLDSNAAFSNVVFLTAFDKKQVNKILGERYQTDDACFVDKFFNLEFIIPNRPYLYIRNYMIKVLPEKMSLPKSESGYIKNALERHTLIFQKYLTTLRDAKRYINLVSIDYPQVCGEVNIEEYLLIHLIKYKYPEEYNKIYKKEYFASYSGFFGNPDIYFLKNNIDEKLPILDILKILFPQEKESRSNYYRHIYDKHGFENYFVNQIYNSLRIGEMSHILTVGDKNYQTVNDWLKDENKTNDFVNYLRNIDDEAFANKEAFFRFVDIILYITVKKPQSLAYWIFLRLITKSNIEGYIHKYNIDKSKYKTLITDYISDVKLDCNLHLLRMIHQNIKSGRIEEESIMLDDSELFQSIKVLFQTLLSADPIDEDECFKCFRSCISHVESNLRYIDTECCGLYKQHLVQKPDYYINRFVYLRCESSNSEWNDVTCDFYSKQIFGSWDNVKLFIQQCADQKVPKSDIALSFWELFEANEYQPISFEGQGIVQEKIDNGFADELPKLRLLKRLQKELSTISEPVDTLSSEERKNSLVSLNNIKEQIDSIDLYIALNGKIKTEVLRLLNMYEQ